MVSTTRRPTGSQAPDSVVRIAARTATAVTSTLKIEASLCRHRHDPELLLIPKAL
jgi:hypothetical protein